MARATSSSQSLTSALHVVVGVIGSPLARFPGKPYKGGIMNTLEGTELDWVLDTLDSWLSDADNWEGGWKTIASNRLLPFYHHA